MEETVTIIKIETKNTKAGAPMWTATTSSGKMSCFDKDLANELFNSVGKTIVVEVEMQGVYKNLKSIIKNPVAPSIQPANQIQQTPLDSKIQLRIANASYCISYAKDLCVAGKIEYKDLETAAINILGIYERMIEPKPEAK